MSRSIKSSEKNDEVLKRAGPGPISLGHRSEESGNQQEELRFIRGNVQNQIGPRDAIGLLKRHLWLISVTIILGTLLCGGVAYSLPEKYTTTSTLVFERRNAQLSQAAGQLEGSNLDRLEVETEMDVLASRDFAARLVDRLNLVEDPFFNPFLRTHNVEEMPFVLGWLVELGLLGSRDGQINPNAGVIRDRVIANLMSSLKVTRSHESLAVYIGIEHADPERAAYLANAVADEYVAQSLEQKKEAIESAAMLLERRIKKLAAVLAEKEQALADHVRTNELNVSGQDNRREDQLRAEIARLKAQLKLFEQQNEGGLISDPVSKADNLKEHLAALEKELERLTLANIRYRTLEQKLVTDRDRYNKFLEKLVTLQSQADIQRPVARVISKAEVPVSPSSPKRKMMIASGFLVSTMLATLLAMLADGIFTAIRSGQRIYRIAGIPNLAYIPEVPRKLTAFGTKPYSYLGKNPQSFFAESFRTLLMACLRGDLVNPPQTIMLTSGLPGEGKSTVALGLGVSSGGLGYKTIVVDLDLHRCGLTKATGIEETNALLDDYLLGNCTLAHAIQCNAVAEGVDLLAVKPSKQPPSSVLNSNRLRELLNRLRKDYEIVIFDTPAALIVNDASFLTPLVDAAILVLRWGKTTESALQDVVSRLHLIHTPLIGSVINRVEPRAHARYGYGGPLAYYKDARKYYAR